MAKSQARSTQRRRDILRAALACFVEHGVDGTTIEMIRDRSGASIGSLYHHFGNKERLAATLFLHGLAEFTETLLARLARSSDARSGISAMVESYIDWVTANPDWARFILQTRGQVIRGDAADQLASANRQQLLQLRAWLLPQVEQGALRALPLELYHPLIIGPVQEYTRAWLAGRARQAPATHRAAFTEAAWRAVGIAADDASPA
ncbi:MAG TPA: TetR/AcrR family transcriptional regulator [Gammaproteobacteria bacterium]|nr:TetR/AcrR family transcriptional regulator [Gammaproteobacteria bacterium]